MTLRITTVYHNVDQEWLAWWMREMGPMYSAQSLPHAIQSKDPTSSVIAETKIVVEDEDGLPLDG